MILYVFLVLCLIITVFGAERNSICKTPNGEEAKCITIQTCRVLLNSIISGKSEAIAFAKKSQCGYDTKPLVCCGSFGHSLPVVTIFSRFSDTKEEELDTITPYSSFLNVLLPGSEICGIDREVDQQKDDSIRNFPWSVLIKYSYENVDKPGVVCNGTLISSQFVLISAHCGKVQNQNNIIAKSVLVGERIFPNNTCSNKKCSEIGITSIFIHNNYNKTLGVNDDIALIKLKSEILFNTNIKPICLSAGNVNYKNISMINKEINNNEATNLNSSITTIPKCSEMRQNASHTNKSLACRSGEFLFSSNNEQTQWYLIGMFSNSSNNSRLITKISPYYEWIVKTVLRHL